MNAKKEKNSKSERTKVSRLCVFKCMLNVSLKDSDTRFFHESSSPKPLKITLGSLQIFSKICGDIRKSGAPPPVSTTLVVKKNLPPVLLISVANLQPISTTMTANFDPSSTGVVDTGGKFATGVNDTSGKFATCVNDAGGNLPPVSLTPVENLPPLSMTLVENNGNNIRLLTT